MNNKVFKTFYTQYGFEFEEYLDSFIVNLKKSNIDYCNIVNNIEHLKETYPKLRDFMENDKYTNLNLEEQHSLFKLLDLRFEANSLEAKELFFKGGTEAINNLKRLELI